MTKVERKLIYRSEFIVECGVDAQGESPADALFELLRSGTWENEDSDEYPDSRQPGLYRRIKDIIQRLADNEELRPSEYRRLREGIWEIKVANIRVTFYDTDGQGGFTPKHGEKVLDWDQKPRWELPYDFDEFLRLGVTWEKISQLASEEDIQASIQFREEDVDHDRSTSSALR